MPISIAADSRAADVRYAVDMVHPPLFVSSYIISLSSGIFNDGNIKKTAPERPTSIRQQFKKTIKKASVLQDWVNRDALTSNK